MIVQNINFKVLIILIILLIIVMTISYYFDHSENNHSEKPLKAGGILPSIPHKKERAKIIGFGPDVALFKDLVNATIKDLLFKTHYIKNNFKAAPTQKLIDNARSNDDPESYQYLTDYAESHHLTLEDAIKKLSNESNLYLSKDKQVLTQDGLCALPEIKAVLADYAPQGNTIKLYQKYSMDRLFGIKLANNKYFVAQTHIPSNYPDHWSFEAIKIYKSQEMAEIIEPDFFEIWYPSLFYGVSIDTGIARPEINKKGLAIEMLNKALYKVGKPQLEDKEENNSHNELPNKAQ